MNKTTFILSLALIGLSACTTVQFAPSRLDQAYPQRTPASEIELFRSSLPTKKYVEIGAVSACCSADADNVIEMLREKASESGGDALIGLDFRASGGASASVVRYQ